MARIIDRKNVEITTTPGAPFVQFLSLDLDDYGIDGYDVITGTIDFKIWSRVTGDMGSSASTGSFNTGFLTFNRDLVADYIQEISGGPTTIAVSVGGGSSTVVSNLQVTSFNNPPVKNIIDISLQAGSFVTLNGNNVEHMIAMDIEITSGT